MAPASAASSRSPESIVTSGAKALVASFGWSVSSCWANPAMTEVEGVFFCLGVRPGVPGRHTR